MIEYLKWAQKLQDELDRANRQRELEKEWQDAKNKRTEQINEGVMVHFIDNPNQIVTTIIPYDDLLNMRDSHSVKLDGHRVWCVCLEGKTPQEAESIIRTAKQSFDSKYSSSNSNNNQSGYDLTPEELEELGQLINEVVGDDDVIEQQPVDQNSNNTTKDDYGKSSKMECNVQYSYITLFDYQREVIRRLLNAHAVERQTKQAEPQHLREVKVPPIYKITDDVRKKWNKRGVKLIPGH